MMRYSEYPGRISRAKARRAQRNGEIRGKNRGINRILPFLPLAFLGPLRETLFGVALVAAMMSSCSAKATDWKSPADAKELSALEAKTLDSGLSKKRRAELFFLWGQELAAQARGGQLPAGTSAAEMTEAAIGAFEKVVDLRSDLVEDSRYNLEILWKEQGQQGKDSQDKQDSQGKKQDGQDRQDKRQDGQGKNQDKQDKDKQDGADGKQGQGGEKDLSGLVRDKAGSEDIDKALKAELERKALEQEAQAGGIRPVEKDW